MTVGMYIFLSALFVLYILINQEENNKKKNMKNLVKNIKKPDIEDMYYMSNEELSKMYKESLEKIEKLKEGMK